MLMWCHNILVLCLYSACVESISADVEFAICLCEFGCVVNELLMWSQSDVGVETVSCWCGICMILALNM